MKSRPKVTEKTPSTRSNRATEFSRRLNLDSGRWPVARRPPAGRTNVPREARRHRPYVLRVLSSCPPFVLVVIVVIVVLAVGTFHR